MAEEKVEEGERSQMEHRAGSSSGAKPASFQDSGPQSLDSNPSHLSREVKIQEYARDFEWPPQNVRMATMDRVSTFAANPAVENFLIIEKTCGTIPT